MIMKNPRTRLEPETRKQQILEAAVNISIEKGYRQLTRRAIANKLSCSSTLINHYFGDIENLREIVFKIAIEKEIIPILVNGYCIGNQKIPPALKDRVIKYITAH